MFVVGTAGHVDHGKSTLVKALTGIDPDRLQEEKDRGMTIDLGFAWLKLPSGREISIVDVPGHERFIKNMLAGVGGIDVALLVIAADEGVMPQTEEHLAILEILRIKRAVVVLTKRDLVADDWLELILDDVRNRLDRSTLGQSEDGVKSEIPIAVVSAVTGDGLPELLAMLDGALDNTPAREDRGRPRLPIDRVFTSAGFGTIATGTLIGGKLTIGLELEVQPGDITTRARGLQTHKSKVDVALPGSRVAINLAGLALTDLRRGQVVTIPGWLASTRAVDVSLRALPGAGPIAHNAPITFHTGSAETLGRVFLLDADEMAPGETAWAQIRLEEPVALAKGDLFVIRDTRETIGGGEIVEPHAKRHRRCQSAVIETLVSLQKGTPEELVLRAADAKEPVALAQVVKASGLTNDVLQPEVAKLLADGRLLRIGESYLALSAWGKLRERAEETLTAYHKSFPLRIGMPREELKSKLGLPTKLYPIVLDKLIAKGAVAAHDTTIALAGFSVKLGAAEERKVGRLIERLSAERYSPSSLNELAVELNLGPELIAWLVESGRVKRLSDSIALLPEAYDDLTQGVVKLIKDRGSITVAEVRDLFGTSRKYALALVEHLDQRRITRREGDNRVLW